MIFDPLYIILMLPAMALAFFASAKVKGNLNKFSKMPTRAGVSGADVAAKILADNGIRDVEIERLPENQPWADHYDPKAKKIRLSAHVHDSSSVSAVAVAAHEVGHAIQHSEAYVPLAVRSGIFPVVRIGSGAAIPLIIAGLFLGMLGWLAPETSNLIMLIGIIMFSTVVAFQLITLPVEYNASRRAREILEGGRYLADAEEMRGTQKVLSAAALTYVAAAAASIMQLIYWISVATRNR
ncbi:MAG: zinc metallopeptidase [Clostridiales bacterium]|jgi:Zn-dependent membrane protease YugP|nr:zinc metallopeptidase [Clostridiales bacterium]